MDTLEKFITDHRTELDDATPRPEVWDKIEAALDGTAKVRKLPRNYRLWQIAAVGLLLMVAGIGIGKFGLSSAGGQGTLTNASTPGSSLAAVAPEHAEAELFFNRQIAQKVKQLRKLGSGQQVEKDLALLEDQMKELKQAYEEAPGDRKEFIVSAMIENYQLRIQLLERVLEELEFNKQIENTTDNEKTVAI